MPRPVTLLCLIAALTGPLLQEAEAAGDFARWMSGALDDRAGLEPIDGGVGDEPYVASNPRIGLDADAATAPAPNPPVPILEPLVPRTLEVAGPEPRDTGFVVRVGGPRRHAWLQLFQF